MLRLSSTVIGPVSVGVGANGPQQEVEAFNLGSGQLSLGVTSTTGWASPAVGAPRACTTRSGTCIPIQIGLVTQALAAGTYAAKVTVSDPNAVDAPQNIDVIVQVGGGVPSTVNLYVAPNGSSDQVDFKTNSNLTWNVATQSGGNWLTVVSEAQGSFDFVRPFRISAKNLDGMAEGTYKGTVQTQGSNFAPDNKSINVNLQVTSQPIASVSSATLPLRIAAGAPQQTAYLSVANRGLGTLSITNVAAAGSGGDWLTAEAVPNSGLIAVKANVGMLATGRYPGTVTITTNAVNSPITVPVTLDVIPASPPVAAFHGVVDNASFSAEDSVAQGGIVALFGEQLSLGEPASASSIPLPTTLGGVSVFVNDLPAPLYYASYGQINFQVPYNTPAGDVVVRVDRDGQRGNSVSVNVQASVPRFLKVGNYVISQNSDFSLSLPTALGGRPAHVGETVVIYALGLGQTNPPVQSGAAAPSNPLAHSPAANQNVLFGVSGFLQGTPVQALYVGLTPNLVGLYQINVTIPPGFTGDVPIRLQLDGVASDIGFIAVE